MTKAEKKGPRVKGMTLIIIIMVAVVAGGVLTVASVYLNGSSTKTASLSGVLTIYASASYSGPRTSSASYNVTLTSKNGSGTLNLTQITGSSDLVREHSYRLSDVVVSPYNLTMIISGSNVSMGWITTSTIWGALNASYGTASGISNTTYWNDLNSSYAAASGPDAPANETIGNFSPSVFQLPTTYYMFLCVTIPQPPYQIPFMVAPVMAAKAAGS